MRFDQHAQPLIRYRSLPPAPSAQLLREVVARLVVVIASGQLGSPTIPMLPPNQSSQVVVPQRLELCQVSLAPLP